MNKATKSIILVMTVFALMALGVRESVNDETQGLSYSAPAGEINRDHDAPAHLNV